MIPYSCQSILEEDVEAVVDVLRSPFLTQGPTGPAFEKSLAEYCGARHATTVASATAALHLACLAMDLGKGDYLWTSPNTFVASANCGLYCGAKVDFVDIDPRTYNLSVPALEEKLAQAAKVGKLPKIVVPVHFGGQSCAMKEIHALSLQYGFKVIEDASHALGADYLDQKIGNGRYSDATVFSFHAVKMITTGEGGAVVTNDASLARKVERLRTHGITRDLLEMSNKTAEPWYYEQVELGYHYRMTDLQAALGVSQLQRLDQFVAHRRDLASAYFDALNDSGLGLPWQEPSTSSSWHLFPILCKDAAARSDLFHKLREQGLGVNVHYIPVYRQPYYQRLSFSPGLCPAAESYYARTLSLPIHQRIDRTVIKEISCKVLSLI
ncbi:UDP-4-amino-4,6-dideoxy-N-acetyl-beta-L-altrosamine transaminase [soil metagenome]